MTVLDFLTQWCVDHADTAGTLLGAAASSSAGVWAMLRRFRTALREEVSSYAASKEDMARVEGKLDVVIDVIKTEVLAPRPAVPATSSSTTSGTGS